MFCLLVVENPGSQGNHHYPWGPGYGRCGDEGDSVLAKRACTEEELKYYRSKVDPNDPTTLKRPTVEDEREKFKAAQETKMVDFVPGNSSKQFAIGSNLTDKSKSMLIKFIHENRNVFACKPSDMPVILTKLAEHSLHVDPKARPVKQGLRKMNEERRKAIGEEIARLLAVGFIMEVFHPQWLANPVLV